MEARHKTSFVLFLAIATATTLLFWYLGGARPAFGAENDPGDVQKVGLDYATRYCDTPERMYEVAQMAGRSATDGDSVFASYERERRCGVLPSGTIVLLFLRVVRHVEGTDTDIFRVVFARALIGLNVIYGPEEKGTRAESVYIALPRDKN